MKKFENMLILSDMDGTLLDDNRVISKENIEAIQYFVDNGGRFSIATGRARRAVVPYLSKLPINAPVVLFNGSEVYDFEANRIISQTTMDDGAVDFIKEVCDMFDFVGAEVFLADSEYIAKNNDITRYHFAGIGLEPIVLQPENIPKPWVKINFTAPVGLIEVVERWVTRVHKGRYFYQRSGANFFEAQTIGVDKGTGAIAVCEALGFDRKNMYTIGDHFNDIELIEAGAIAFAPENAVPRIKGMADVIVKDNNSSAVAAMIEWLDKNVAQR